jgi:hypothetical protein
MRRSPVTGGGRHGRTATGAARFWTRGITPQAGLMKDEPG